MTTKPNKDSAPPTPDEAESGRAATIAEARRLLQQWREVGARSDSADAALGALRDDGAGRAAVRAAADRSDDMLDEQVAIADRLCRLGLAALEPALCWLFAEVLELLLDPDEPSARLVLARRLLREWRDASDDEKALWRLASRRDAAGDRAGYDAYEELANEQSAVQRRIEARLCDLAREWTGRPVPDLQGHDPGLAIVIDDWIVTFDEGDRDHPEMDATVIPPGDVLFLT